MFVQSWLTNLAVHTMIVPRYKSVVEHICDIDYKDNTIENAYPLPSLNPFGATRKYEIRWW